MTGRVVGGFVLVAALAAPVRADRTAFGFGAYAGSAPFPSETRPSVVGDQIYLARWYGRFGLAAEASVQALTDSWREGGGTLGVSARVQLLSGVTHRRIGVGSGGWHGDLKYGVELQTILQREWWDLEERDGDTREATRATYGVGLALFAGGPTLTRSAHVNIHLDVRVMFAPRAREDGLARAVEPMAPADTRRHDIGVVVGLGMDVGSLD